MDQACLFAVSDLYIHKLKVMAQVASNNNRNVSSIVREISACKSYEQYQEISEESLFAGLKDVFPQLFSSINETHVLKDKAVFSGVKALADQYLALMETLSPVKQPQSNLELSDSNQKAGGNLERRNITRAMFAMRNVKNQQELKKDQIFVRVIPKTQNCIAFMLNNKNFPRIEVKLSCNQHLEYLINYLTNKWLRGKVGVGYQILLYPDPSIFLRRYPNEEINKRNDARYEPLNNYLMFTDILAACGNPNHSSLNLYYEILELRKEKKKIIREKQIPLLPSLNHNSSFFKNSQNPLKIMRELETPGKEKFKSEKDEFSIERRSEGIHAEEDISIGVTKEKKINFSNNFQDEDFASLAFNWNHHNSNHHASNFFNNNSNTFLNGNHLYSSLNDSKPAPQPQEKGSDEKLNSIRNYISMIEKEVKHQEDPINESSSKEKEENSLIAEVSQKKQTKEVKTISIIRKKNTGE